jgi:hypothetical protein
LRVALWQAAFRLPLVFPGCFEFYDRFRQFRVSFIVTMEMEEEQIAQRIVAVIMVDVVNL